MLGIANGLIKERIKLYAEFKKHKNLIISSTEILMNKSKLQQHLETCKEIYNTADYGELSD